VISLLFSFRGRINRTKYWFVTGVVTLGIFLIVLSFALAELDGVGLAPGFLLIVLLLISGLAAGVKRLHDRDKSGWWLLFYGPGSGIFQAIGDALGGQGFARLVPAERTSLDRNDHRSRHPARNAWP
jgi:uncharacterized membrane protein HdeD (DUF308 family)